MSRGAWLLVGLTVAGVAGARPRAQVRTEPRPAPRSASAGAPTSAAALREELQRVQAVLERALNARQRYDLGLPVQTEPYVALTDAERASRKDAAERQLLEEQARVSGLSSRLAAAQDKLAKVQERVAQVMNAQGDGMREVTPVFATPPQPNPPEPFALAEEPPPSSPGAEPAVPAPGSAAPVLLRGSEDHSRVGRALFFAKRYDRAREELEAAVARSVDLVDLFYLARSCEALGDTAKADELYLQVEVKDTVEVDGKKQVGTWARAARVARRHMQWMRDNAPWQPARPLEKVQWRAR